MTARTKFVPLLALALVALTACEKPRAWGEWNAIIVAADPELWPDYEPIVEGALETTVVTVRPERTFRVTYQDPTDTTTVHWDRLQRFYSVLVIGDMDDPWVREALDESGRDTFAPPEILQVEDVWARGQRVTVLLTSPEGGADEVASLADDLHDLLDRQYRDWVIARMYQTGRDTALADSLALQAGFRILLPDVYEHRVADSVHIFRNDNPDPSELIREIAVTWRTPIPPGYQADSILAWRQEVADRYYDYPQVLDLSNVTGGPMKLDDMQFYEIRAAWSNPPEDSFPAAGPFIVRAVLCPRVNKMFLVDAWLYAPGKDKYQYMIQLETILDSFRCAA